MVVMTMQSGGDLEEIIMIAEMMWLCILSIVCVAFTVYSFYVAKMLYLSAKLSMGQHFESNAKQTMRRLIIINSGITLFFLFKLITFAFFSSLNNLVSFIWYRAFDLFLN